MSLKKIRNFVLDILFPERCSFCDKVVGFGPQCGCLLAEEGIETPAGVLDLVQNRQINSHVQQVWACYWYRQPVRGAILRLKFEDQPELAAPLAKEMFRQWKEQNLTEQFDCIVPVPSSAKTMRERGYSQTFLLAKHLGQMAGVPVLDDVLYKTMETERQALLGREDRLANVQGSIAVKNGGLIQGKRVCLLDDVITTGSTLNECGKIILNAGAGYCGAVCLASTCWRNGGTEQEEQ